MAIWDYIHGYAAPGRAELVTFYDHNDETLYRDVSLQIIGQHGWELISVLQTRDDETGEQRYEYFFKRNREEGYAEGFGQSRRN